MRDSFNSDARLVFHIIAAPNGFGAGYEPTSAQVDNLPNKTSGPSFAWVHLFFPYRKDKDATIYPSMTATPRSPNYFSPENSPTLHLVA